MAGVQSMFAEILTSPKRDTTLRWGEALTNPDFFRGKGDQMIQGPSYVPDCFSQFISPWNRCGLRATLRLAGHSPHRRCDARGNQRHRGWEPVLTKFKQFLNGIAGAEVNRRRVALPALLFWRVRLGTVRVAPKALTISGRDAKPCPSSRAVLQTKNK